MKLKRTIVVILLLLSVFTAGCGKSKADKGNKNPQPPQESTTQHQSQDNTNQPQDPATENPKQASFDLNVSVRSARNAIFTIDGIDQALANANRDIKKIAPAVIKAVNTKADVGLQWQINFESYILLARFDNVQMDDPPVSYLLKQVGSDTINFGFPDAVRKGDQLEISLTLPEGEVDLFETETFEMMYNYSVRFPEGAEKLNDKAFQTFMEDLGGLYFSRTFSRSMMTAVLPAPVFPAVVYDMGFSEGPGDDTYFHPATEDYVILPQPREDGAPLEIHLLIEFDAAGYISNIIKRIGEPGADEEMIKRNVESYRSGYGVSSASYAGQYIYLTYDEEYLRSINYPVSNSWKAISTKELMLDNKKLTKTSGEVLSFDSNQVFVSNPQLTETQLSMPEYCKPEDFFLFRYRVSVPPSEDFVIYESKSGEEVYGTITYFDNRGNTILSEKMAYSKERKIYQNVHPDNAHISYSVQNDGNTKRNGETPMARTGFYLEKNYSSYQEAIDAGDWAVYYSNPVLW